MNRRLVACALAGSLTLLASAPAAAVEVDAGPVAATSPPALVLPTTQFDPALLPADPDVVTDEDLATAGAPPGVQQITNDPNQLVVDDDLAQCPNAGFTTAAGVQAAIEAAAPGTKIRVCPGNYSPINVHKTDLWLQAPRGQGAANGCREGNPMQDAIIEGSSATGLVQIVAAGVRFEGFIVQGNAAGPGVRTDSAGSGYELVFNEVRGNQYGIDLNTNGLVETLVEHNCIRNNTALSIGILSNVGFSNAAVDNNFFSGHRCSAIANIPAATAAPCQPTPFVPISDVTFSHNSLVDDTSASFIGGTNVVMDYNHFLRPFGVCVFLQNVVGANVSFNHIDGNGAASQGIFVAGDPNVVLDVVVRDNKLENLQGGVAPNFQFFGFGVSVRGIGVTVLQNWIQFNHGSGIFLGPQSDGSTVRGNLLIGNGIPGTDAVPRQASDGIRVMAGAVGNVIENNRLGEPLIGSDPAERANRDHDCHDDNASGANVWRHNVGYTENQPGLCVRLT
jgi:hypothetical protein